MTAMNILAPHPNRSIQRIRMHMTMAVTVQGLTLCVSRLGFDRSPKEQDPGGEKTKSRRWIGGFKDLARAMRNASIHGRSFWSVPDMTAFLRKKATAPCRDERGHGDGHHVSRSMG